MSYYQFCEDCYCGLSDRQRGAKVLNGSRIIDGGTAKVNEFPWMVYIKIYDRPGGPNTKRCGGSLINDRFVLSAKHCFAKGIRPSDIREV